jgi:hypothetical protein
MSGIETLDDGEGFVPLFNGTSLAGWRTAPRIYGSLYPGGPSVLEVFEQDGRELPLDPKKHPARWFVEDGVLVGEQDSPGSGYGGYLVSEQAYGDFELVLEMRPDWPADTGVMLRRRPDSWEGSPTSTTITCWIPTARASSSRRMTATSTGPR